MDIKVYSLTHIGLVRSKNQDNFYCEGITPGSENESFGKGGVFSMDKPLLFGVFDGMGGHLHGERAAAIAVETCGQLFDNYGGGNPYGVLNEICRVSNQRICDEMKAVVKGRMGSTASMLLFEHGLAFICNLGDSPVFLIRGGAIKQISYEHTERRNYEQAFGDNYNYNKRRKFRLTQHLGILPGEAKLSPYNSQRDIRCDDKFLICSDGLTDMVEKEEIASIVSNARSLETASRTLLERALENGGRDNITIILCEIGKQSTLNTGKKKRFPGILQRKAKTDKPKQKEQQTEPIKQAAQEVQKPQAEQTIQAPKEAQKPQAEQTIQAPKEAQKPQAEQTQAPQKVQKPQTEQTQAPKEVQKPQAEQTEQAPQESQEPQAEQIQQEPQIPITQKVPQESQSEQVKELQESLKKEKRKTIIAIAAALAVTAAAILSVVLFTLFRQPKEQTPTGTTQSTSVQQTTEQAAFALSESEEGKASAVKDSASKVMGEMEAELIKQAQTDAETTKPNEKDSKDTEKDKKEATEPTEKSGDNKEKNKTEATQPTEKNSDNKEKNKAEEANDGNGSELRQWQL